MNDQRQSSLPPFPPSDSESLSRNDFNAFWRVRARDFWGDNQINRAEVQPFPNCDHYFISKGQGAECKICHIGFTGPLYKVSNGKIFFTKEELEK